MKTPYETPSVADLGTFEDVTQGSASGSALDRAFPNNTPFEDLTFS